MNIVRADQANGTVTVELSNGEYHAIMAAFYPDRQDAIIYAPPAEAAADAPDL